VLEILQDARGRVRIEADMDEDLPKIAGVQPEMRAILHALLTNAVEASPDGGRVTVKAWAIESGGIRIEVDDEGPGLSQEVKERLFTPHVTTKANGTGMGLYLAHRIASSRYGGSLSLEDRQPQGTRAIVELTHRRSGTDE
jgi:signal transduction histidine kinase